MLVVKDGTSTVIYPADRCSWKQADDTSGYGYKINTAVFYNATGTTSIANPVLGYIGKSGRFVAISN